MPLRRRLVALIALLLALSLAGGGVLTYWQGLRKIDLEMMSAMDVGEAGVRDALTTIGSSLAPDTHLRRIISSFDGDRHVRATLKTADGTDLVASRVRAPVDPAPAWLLRLLYGPKLERRIALPGEIANLGTIHLTADPTNEISEVWDDAKLKLFIVGSFCALVLAMTQILLDRALRPLEKFSGALARVGQGDYRVQVDESGPAELTDIYKAFNRMAAELETAERQNSRLNEQLSTVQDEERAEIARDLHDEIGPFLFAVDADAQTIPALLEKQRNDEAIAHSKAIRQSVGHMQMHLRGVLARLRPALLLDLGLHHAVEQLVAFWRARRPGIVFETDIIEERIPAPIEEVAFRIAQEGISNAIRHGKPTRIAIVARRENDGELQVSVCDDGSGITQMSTRRGFGITGMGERVGMLGGTLDVSKSPRGTGVTLVARLPIPAREASARAQSKRTSSEPDAMSRS